MVLVPGYYGYLWLVLAILAIIESFGTLALFMMFMVLYTLGSYVNWRLGNKFAIGSFTEFFLPVYGTMLLCDCVKMTRWLTVAFFLPFLPSHGALGGLVLPAVVISYMFLYGKIAQRLGRNPWLWGVISVFFLGIPIMVMAFDKSMPVDGEKVKSNSGDGQGSGM